MCNEKISFNSSILNDFDVIARKISFLSRAGSVNMKDIKKNTASTRRVNQSREIN